MLTTYWFLAINIVIYISANKVYGMFMLCYVMFMLCYVYVMFMLCLYDVYVMLCLCYVMLCYVMLCYVMLMLCYVMLCYVMFMLCYVMLCYVMLCLCLCYVYVMISETTALRPPSYVNCLITWPREVHDQTVNTINC